MNKNKMRCPHCDKCVGVFITTDYENSIAQVFRQEEKIVTQEKYSIFETKCPRCKNIFNILLAFKD